MKSTSSTMILSLGQLILLVTLASLTTVQKAECGSVGDYMNGAKNYLVGLVREGVLNKNTVVTSFTEAMGNIKDRFQEAKSNGELDGKSEDETSAFYYKLVIEEIRKLKEKIAVDDANKQESAQDKFMAACTNCAKNLRMKQPQYDMMDMEMDMDDDDDEELELMNELDNLEELNKKETEMGWGLNAENRAALQARTLQVLGDLVQNELKTLAMIIITGYIGGPAAGAIGPAVQAANVSIKFKLIEFFMQSVMDTFAGLLGQKISPQMSNPLADQNAVVASKQ